MERDVQLLETTKGLLETNQDRLQTKDILKESELENSASRSSIARHHNRIIVLLSLFSFSQGAKSISVKGRDDGAGRVAHISAYCICCATPKLFFIYQ